jgi:Concanavalin A-like lectin/glucanases superfamily
VNAQGPYSGAITDGVWTAVAITLKESTTSTPIAPTSALRVYIGGVQAATATVTGVPAPATTTGVRVGYGYSGLKAFFTGYVDEMRVSSFSRYNSANYTLQTRPFPRADALSLYYPGRGQYWLIFEDTAIVLTVNGNSLKTWSRYTFPDVITDWTLNGGLLYLRTWNDYVWQFNMNARRTSGSGPLLGDDCAAASPNTGTPFTSVIQWPYVDFGRLGIEKQLDGVDIVGTGAVDMRIAWDESDQTAFYENDKFTQSLTVSPSFIVNPGDTVPGNPVPLPATAPSFSLILIYANSTGWEWQASSMYLVDQSGGGATG